MLTRAWWLALVGWRAHASPQLFRERIPAYATLVRRYYATVLALIGSVVGGALGLPVVSLAGLVGWAVLTGWLFVERLPSQLTPAGVGQAFITSLVTPFLSVFWRLYGAVKYRAGYW